MNIKKLSSLEVFFKEDQFFTNFKAKNRESALKGIFQIISTKYPVPKKFYDSIIERELLTSTAFGNLVALPHTIQLVSHDSFAYVVVLDEAIDWNGRDVQVIFLINVGDCEGQGLIEFYDQTMPLILNNKAIKSLIEYPYFSHLMSLFRNN